MDGFRTFVLRGDVVDLAVAVVVGAAFGAVVTGFVTAFIAPLVGVATGAAGDVSRRRFELAGVEFPYGVLLQALISFVLVSAVVHVVVVRPVQHLMDRLATEPEPASPTRQCPECLSAVPQAARRCASCTVELSAHA